MPAIDPIDADAVRRRVPGDAWPEIEVRPSVDSTNRLLCALAGNGARPGTVVATTDQTAGRGRHTRSWTTPPGVSLAVSMLIRPTVPPARWSWLPLATGLAIGDAIAATTGLQVELKWPNDLLIDGRKVCGILAEQVMVDGDLCVVIGCGINVAMDADELPVPTATSIHLAGGATTMTDLLVAVLAAMTDSLETWQSRPEVLTARYEQACGTIGRRIRVQTLPDADPETDPDAFVHGIATGVDDTGGLRVDVDGIERVFNAGDVVHVRPSRR